MPLILSGNVASALPTGYDVANSCRFDGTNDYMVRSATGSSTESNNKWTFSCWVKRAKLGAEQMILDHRGSGNQFNIRFTGNDSIQAYDYVGGNLMQKDTNAEYRDPAAWYHILWSSDRSIGSPTTKLWVNGTEVTSFATDNEYSQDDTGAANQNYDTWIGGENSSGSRLGAYLAEVVWLDGTFVSDATGFGEYDEDSPTIWKPIDPSGLTFGTNGYYFDFEASDNLGNDANGGTDFSETGIASVDQATDTPTNNFCTINNLSGEPGTYTFSQGNCQIASGHTSWYTKGSTMAVANGKWFWEVELDAGTMIEIMVGFHDTSVSLDGTNRWVTGSMVFYNDNGGEFRIDGVETTANYGTLTAGDILGFALNMDDKQLTLYDNGSAIATNVSIGSNINEAMPTFLTDANDVVFKANFGGCSGFTVSSANQDGNGYGNFEYAVPSGYYALCTKNLAEYG